MRESAPANSGLNTVGAQVASHLRNGFSMRLLASYSMVCIVLLCALTETPTLVWLPESKWPATGEGLYVPSGSLFGQRGQTCHLLKCVGSRMSCIRGGTSNSDLENGSAREATGAPRAAESRVISGSSRAQPSPPRSQGALRASRTQPDLGSRRVVRKSLAVSLGQAAHSEEEHIVGPSTAFTMRMGVNPVAGADETNPRNADNATGPCADSTPLAFEGGSQLLQSGAPEVGTGPRSAAEEEGGEHDSDSFSQADQVRRWTPPEESDIAPPASRPSSAGDASSPRSQWPSPSSLAVTAGLVAVVAFTLVSIASLLNFFWSSASDALPPRAAANLQRAARFVQRKEVLPILYMLAGYWLSDWLSLTANRRYLSGLRIDRTTSIFLKGLVKYASMSIAFTIVLKALGIKTQGIDNILASIGIAIGFASQKILQNLAGGVILLIFRPFKVGDMLNVNGQVGWVTKIMLFETRLRTDDRREICIPNAAVYDSHIVNLTCDPMRRVEIPVYTAGSTDVRKAKKVIEEAIAPFGHYWKTYQKERLFSSQPRGQSATTRILDSLKKSASSMHFPPFRPSLLYTARAPQGVELREQLRRHRSLESLPDFRPRTQGEPEGPKHNYGWDAPRQHHGGYLEYDDQGANLPFGMPNFLELSDPFVVLCELDTYGTYWLAMVWVPARWYYPCRAAIIESIAESLQKNDVETVSNVLAKRGIPMNVKTI